MDFNLIHIGIVLVIALIVLLIMWPRNNSFHRSLCVFTAVLSNKVS